MRLEGKTPSLTSRKALPLISPVGDHTGTAAKAVLRNASRYVSTSTGAPGPDAATLATGDSGGGTACGVIRR